MKAFIYTFLFILTHQTIGFSQTVDWAGQFSTERGINVVDMSNDIQGNIYLCGTFGDTADLDPGPNVLELYGKTYISKLDVNGNLVWAKSFAGFGPNLIRADASQNVYVGFNLDNTVDVDPGPAVLEFTADGFGDFVLLKLDPNGDLIWAQQYGDSSSDRIFGLDIASDGSILASGFFGETMDFDLSPGTSELTTFGSRDIYVLKLDTDGNFQWVQQFGGSGFDYCEGLFLDSNDNIYFIGEFTGMADFDPGAGTLNLTAQGSSDIYVCKLNASGGLEWAGNLGSTGTQLPTSLFVGDNGHLFVAGYFNGSGDFDPGPGVTNLSSTGNDDVFIAKISSSTGEAAWIRAFQGNEETVNPSVVENDQGIVFTVGGFSGTTDFDPGPEVFNLVSTNVFDVDIFISRLDSDGNFECARKISGPDTELPRRLLLSPAGDLVMGGIFEGTIDFDPGPGVTELTNNGESGALSDNGSDVFIIQLSGVEACPPVSVFDPTFANELTVFPNPTSGLLTIDLDQVYSGINIRIMDVMGRTLSNRVFESTDQVAINLNQPSGIYFIEIEVDEKRSILKIIKE